MKAAVALAASLIAATATAATEPAPAPAREQVYLEHDYLFVENRAIQDYLQSIVDKLLQGRTEKFAAPNLIVYSAGNFSAAADTDGNLVISTQTLRDLESEDELAALLGHELTHVIKGHASKKGVMQTLPVSLDSMQAISDAAHQVRASVTGNGAAAGATQGRYTGAQAAALFWSDILSPNWNRKQEREADRIGLDLMRAAGYDPAAFTTLFSKLHAAHEKRSERMEAFQKAMVTRLQKPKLPRTTLKVSPELEQALGGLQGEAASKVVDGAFDDLNKRNAEYDSPEQRQELITQYLAQSKIPMSRDKKARSPLFAQNLRAGEGGTLLHQDEQALAALDALDAGDVATAQASIAELLPPKAAAARSAFHKPSSAHLNLALGSWYDKRGDGASRDAHVGDWVASSRAPVTAFLWQASNAAARDEPSAAIDTLEQGGRRIGSPVPFLPDLISFARQAGSESRAESFTRQCKEEDARRKSATTKLVSAIQGSQPTGLYAECLARLGRLPDGETQSKGGLLKLAPLLRKATS